MNYVTHEDLVVKRITCNHPKVKKIWEWGALAAVNITGEMVHCISLILDNDERVDFKSEKENDPVYKKVESYLQNI
jgi:hypothetical protein